MMRLTAVVVTLMLIGPIAVEAREIDDEFVAVTPSETVVAPLDVGGVLTTGQYQGLVRLDVSGSGTNNVEATDGFYSFQRPLGTPVAPFPPIDGAWVTVGEELGGSCLDFGNTLATPASLITVFVDGLGTVVPAPFAAPPYSASHDYAIVVDIGAYSGRVYVGNRDCGFGDNTGALEITVTGVEPIPVTTTTTSTTSNPTSTTTSTSTTLCLELPDSDGDGETNATDRCPDTAAGEPVDDAGCSLAQFCGTFDATTSDGQRDCKKADWRNDEPRMQGRDRDCTIDRGADREQADDTCVPYMVP